MLKASRAAGGVVALVLGLTVAAASANAAAPQATAAVAAPAVCTAGTTVHTHDGPVCGVTKVGITSYLGIPYAAPPVGDLRWKPPQPVHPWARTLRATQTGPECLQSSWPSGQTFAGVENCLRLQVHVPARTRLGQRLPVMLEIHGGGFLQGFVTNGDNFVQRDVIFVYIRYRLGILGNLALKGLGPHSGDYGLQDQQAAMRWVQRNISAFGGNPRNVTIFGESAGGASVRDQVASPTAKGLFLKGISRSGFYSFNNNTIWWPGDCKSTLITEAKAQRMGAEFASKVGCRRSRNVPAWLRAIPAMKLVRAAGNLETPFAGGAIGPIVNGTTIPVSAGTACKRGEVNNVKLMIGVGRDEFNGGEYSNTSPASPGLRDIVADTAAQYRELVHEQFGSLTPTVERLYPISRFPAPSPFIAYRTNMADAFSVCPALVADQQMSRHITTYAYEDDDAGEPGSGTQPLGAAHSDISELAHANPASLDANQAALQNQVLTQWTGFARTGSPTVNYAPLWPAFSRHSRVVMSLVPAGDSALVPTSTLSAQHNCGFWDRINRNAAFTG